MRWYRTQVVAVILPRRVSRLWKANPVQCCKLCIRQHILELLHAEIARNITRLPVYFLLNSAEGSESRVTHQQSASIAFMAPKNVDLSVTIAWTDPPGSLHATSQLQHDLDLSVGVRGTCIILFSHI